VAILSLLSLEAVGHGIGDSATAIASPRERRKLAESEATTMGQFNLPEGNRRSCQLWGVGCEFPVEEGEDNTNGEVRVPVAHRGG
jgi:hypothetical protein